MFGMKQEVLGKLYNREDCAWCAGKPPEGFMCVYCLSYGDVNERPYSALENRFDEIDLGDTSELDPCWDMFLEQGGDYLALARLGMPPIVLSRLFRLAVNATKGA
jgi:hypothetical protein